MKIKYFRRTAQILTLIAIFVIPLINIYELYFIKGTFYSMDIGDAAMADPLAVFQSMLASGTVNPYMVGSLIIPIALMMLLGRVWCSWFCPYYLIAEMVAGFRRLVRLKPAKPEYTDSYHNKQAKFRYIFLLLGLIVMSIIGVPILNLISAPGVISSQALVLVKFGYVTFEIVFVGVLIFLEFFYFKWWCRLFCPTGTFLSFFRIKQGMTVNKVVDQCSNCMSCVRSCPMMINPMTMGASSHCNNCGDCVDACPDNKKKPTLKFTFK